MSFICSDNLPVITGSEISDMVTKMCGYSVYSHQSDLVNGFITLKGGCRVGICGTAVIQNGAVTAIRELTSVNIRVADLSEAFINVPLLMNAASSRALKARNALTPTFSLFTRSRTE